VVAAAGCISLASCDAYVDKAKYEESQKEIADLKRQLSTSQDELKKAQLALGEYQAHKYQVFHNGFRTWRFDSVTGNSCILLTTKEDWKSKDTKGESCECKDLFEDGKQPDEEWRKIYCGW